LALLGSLQFSAMQSAAFEKVGLLPTFEPSEHFESQSHVWL
jgi:hypothetical protein